MTRFTGWDNKAVNRIQVNQKLGCDISVAAKKESYKKYRNTKVVFDGITFDSKKEYQRYQVLQLLVKMNLISDLKVHPVFVLQESFKLNKKTIRAIKYEGDFEYKEKGQRVVEDVKAIQTPEFKLKRKMFLEKYPEIKFVLVNVKTKTKKKNCKLLAEVR
jgi:hypothetical protein